MNVRAVSANVRSVGLSRTVSDLTISLVYIPGKRYVLNDRFLWAPRFRLALALRPKDA